MRPEGSKNSEILILKSLAQTNLLPPWCWAEMAGRPKPLQTTKIIMFETKTSLLSVTEL